MEPYRLYITGPKRSVATPRPSVRRQRRARTHGDHLHAAEVSMRVEHLGPQRQHPAAASPGPPPATGSAPPARSAALEGGQGVEPSGAARSVEPSSQRQGELRRGPAPWKSRRGDEGDAASARRDRVPGEQGGRRRRCRPRCAARPSACRWYRSVRITMRAWRSGGWRSPSSYAVTSRSSVSGPSGPPSPSVQARRRFSTWAPASSPVNSSSWTTRVGASRSSTSTSWGPAKAVLR